MMIDEPAEIERLAETVADYESPPGYQEEGGIDMFFAKMLIIDAGDDSNRPVVMFMQIAPGINMDQDEAQRHLRQVMQSGLPVIVLTGRQDPDEEAAVRELGVSSYLSKPASADKVLAAISRALA